MTENKIMDMVIPTFIAIILYVIGIGIVQSSSLNTVEKTLMVLGLILGAVGSAFALGKFNNS